MNHEQASRYRSMGEAHLYVAVAKADGVVSDIERRGAGYRAKKAQKMLDIMGINSHVSKRIKSDVETVLTKDKYSTWDSTQHLDRAIELLQKAKRAGDWGAQLAATKNEQGLLGLARLDGYVMKESSMLREIKRRLSELE